MRLYRVNNKTIILIGTVLDVEIDPNVTTSGRRRNFVVTKFDLDGGEMETAIINIRSFNINNPEPLCTATDGDGG